MSINESTLIGLFCMMATDDLFTDVILNINVFEYFPFISRQLGRFAYIIFFECTRADADCEIGCVYICDICM